MFRTDIGLKRGNFPPKGRLDMYHVPCWSGTRKISSFSLPPFFPNFSPLDLLLPPHLPLPLKLSVPSVMHKKTTSPTKGQREELAPGVGQWDLSAMPLL